MVAEGVTEEDMVVDMEVVEDTEEVMVVGRSIGGIKLGWVGVERG